MMVNFDSANIVIVFYHHGSGGKFLINSLGLSNLAVFQDATLATKQIDKQFTPNDKIEFLKYKLSLVEDTWTDLDLGDISLFALPNEFYIYYPTELIKQLKFPPIISELSDSNLKFFVIAHNPTNLKKYLETWPNARIIIFENDIEFVLYRSGMQSKWNRIRGQDWPDNIPVTSQEWESLPPQILAEVQHHYGSFHYSRIRSFSMITQWESEELSRYKNKDNNLHNRISFWDCRWYFSKEDTVTQLGHLYFKLDLPDFNSEYVREYYDLWINKLNDISSK